MRVIVIGCGRLGADLSYRLFKRGHDVSIIDTVAAAFNNLPADFQGRTIEGDALNQDVMHRAGADHADALCTVTNSDALNAVAGRIGKTIFQIPIVIARNYDPNSLNIFEVFDLQTISSTSWGSQRMEEMIYHSEIRMVFSAGNGEVELYELLVPEVWDGKNFDELLGCGECIPVSLTRAGKAIMPNRETVLKNGDVVLISATFDGIRSLRERLMKSKEEA
ncbi:MAG: TrkA family potassium uptake protein [Anaerolineaceae bacterium]